MRVIVGCVIALGLASSCTCSAPTPPAPAVARVAPHPVELTDTGAFHAVRCGDVVAQWTGDRAALEALRTEAPNARFEKSLTMTSLMFALDDGGVTLADLSKVAGTNDSRAFDIFSPDCQHVALLLDRAGPYLVVRTADLLPFFTNQARPRRVVRPVLDGGVLGVLHEASWLDADTLEFTHSCCGGAEVFRASVATGDVKSTFFAPSAPHGIRTGDGGYEVVP
ncbi:MAG: hypothetical protein JNG84_08515 [Archangium sp.]|nr:hypothetical protein [Archangium sp.]